VLARVGLMDLSTFSKFDVRGRDASAFLDRICANNIPKRDGGIVLGHLLNANGFIEGEITVTRLGAEHYYLLSAAAAQLYDFDQLGWRKLSHEEVVIEDVTEPFGTLLLAGPQARKVLAQCTQTDLANAAFPWLTGKETEVADVKGVRLLRINYVGELGWELHCPITGVRKLFEALMAAGKPHDIGLFGTYAMNSLRMEKAYRSWGSELTSEIDMFEAGLDRFIRLDKPEFIGRQASKAAKQRGVRIELVYLAIDALDSDCAGNEPVYAGDSLVGLTTSGAYGHAVEKSLAFAYVDPAFTTPGTTFDILLLGERRHAVVLPEAAWDAANLRPRA
jgi:dimethylglycine dehydrogenase